MARVSHKDARISVTIRLSENIVNAINEAAEYYERPSSSDLIRIALQEWLDDHGYLNQEYAKYKRLEKKNDA